MSMSTFIFSLQNENLVFKETEGLRMELVPPGIFF